MKSPVAGGESPGGKALPSRGAAAAGKPGPAWSIVLQSFNKELEAALAQKTLASVRTEGGLSGAYLDDRGPALVIAYGRYDDPGAPAARKDLERIRTMEFDGLRPFGRAFLVPPERISGATPEFDLRDVRAKQDWARYSLQIGAYARPDRKQPTADELAEFRKTAEQAAAQLRREGELAFYYHGPSRSMVTVGLFGDDDYDAANPSAESAAIKALRKKYPNHLLNGQGTRIAMTATDRAGKAVRMEKLQPSVLVKVP